MSEPTVKALIKQWPEWAFVLSKRRYLLSSYAPKHEVEKGCRTWDISEQDFVRAMDDAGVRVTKDDHHFYVADSPSWKTYLCGLQQLRSGSVPHPLHRSDPTTDFNALLSAERRRLLAWIGEHVSPRQKRTTLLG